MKKVLIFLLVLYSTAAFGQTTGIKFSDLITWEDTLSSAYVPATIKIGNTWYNRKIAAGKLGSNKLDSVTISNDSIYSWVNGTRSFAGKLALSTVSVDPVIGSFRRSDSVFLVRLTDTIFSHTDSTGGGGSGGSGIRDTFYIEQLGDTAVVFHQPSIDRHDTLSGGVGGGGSGGGRFGIEDNTGVQNRTMHLHGYNLGVLNTDEFDSLTTLFGPDATRLAAYDLPSLDYGRFDVQSNIAALVSGYGNASTYSQVYATKNDVELLHVEDGNGTLSGRTDIRVRNAYITASNPRWTGEKPLVVSVNSSYADSAGNVDITVTPSDRRLKNSVQPMHYGLKEILQLKPKTFYYNSDRWHRQLKYGFIAQDVQPVMPTVVRKVNADYLGIENEGIMVAAVRAIQELQAEITALKKEVQRLKTKKTK